MTPPLPLTITLSKLDQLATFSAYLRLQVTDPAAEGFGIDGAVHISTSIDRDAWEALGMPVELPVELHNLRSGTVMVDRGRGARPPIVDDYGQTVSA